MTTTVGVYQRIDTHLKGGFSSDLFNVANPYGFGVYQPPIFVFSNIAQTPSTATPIFGAQELIADVPATLNSSLLVSIQGHDVIPLDCQRNIQIGSLSGAEFGGTGGNIIITGYTNEFQFLEESLTWISTSTFVESAKTYRYIASITSSATTSTATDIYAIPAYLIGLPFYLARPDYVISATYSSAPLDRDLINVGNNWRTTLPSLTSSDARGTVDLSDIFTANTLLVVIMRCYGADSFLQAQLENTPLLDGTATKTVPGTPESLNRSTSAQKIIYNCDDINIQDPAPLVNIPVLTVPDLRGLTYVAG